jgi:hypothetical protein
MNKFNLTPEQIKDICYNAGSLEKAAEVIGCGRETIRYWTIKYNIPQLHTQGKRVYDVDHEFFNKIDDLDIGHKAAYWLGFIAGDGNIDKELNSIKIELGIVDKSHIEKFKKDIGYTGKIFKTQHLRHNKPTVNSCYIKVNSRKLVYSLQEFNFFGGNKTFTYTFPEILENHNFTSDFCRGYFDAEGCFDFRYKTPRIRIASCNLGFLEKMHEVIFKNCNLEPPIKTPIYKNKKLNYNDCYSLEYYNKIYGIPIIKWLYSSLQKYNDITYLDRKFETIKNQLL